jgi:hypothetical protein
MTAFDLTIELPDRLAEEAQRAGLLTARSIADLLAAELRRRQVNQFFAVADQLANQRAPRLTDVEIEAEIAAARAERRQRNARGD